MTEGDDQSRSVLEEAVRSCGLGAAGPSGYRHCRLGGWGGCLGKGSSAGVAWQGDVLPPTCVVAALAIMAPRGFHGG